MNRHNKSQKQYCEKYSRTINDISYVKPIIDKIISDAFYNTYGNDRPESFDGLESTCSTRILRILPKIIDNLTGNYSKDYSTLLNIIYDKDIWLKIYNIEFERWKNNPSKILSNYGRISIINNLFDLDLNSSDFSILFPKEPIKCTCGNDCELLHDTDNKYNNFDSKYVWVCPIDGNKSFCHKDTAIPYGIPADTRTRALRHLIHQALDQITEKNKSFQGLIYHKLSKTFDIPNNDFHVGKLTKDQCYKTIRLLKDWYPECRLIFATDYRLDNQNKDYDFNKSMSNNLLDAITFSLEK